MAEVEGPLQGFRVLELSANLTGPLATMVLADQGADVIKVEPPSGDQMRGAGARRDGVVGMGTAFLNSNRNKRSVVLDLKDPADVSAALELASRCDVVVQNYRPGVIERIGLGYDQVRAVRPDVVYLSIDGVGGDGPARARKVYDPVVQAMAGFASAQGDGTGTPEVIRSAIIDKTTAVVASQAVTAALLRRAVAGAGSHVRVSMLDVALSLIWPDTMGPFTLVGDDVVRSASMSQIRYIYPTLDGHLLASYVSDADWRGLCEAIERVDLIDDPRFSTAAGRGQHPAEVGAELAATFVLRPTDEWLERLGAHDAVFARINHRQDLHEDPQIVAVGAVQEHQHPSAGPYRSPGHPVSFDGERPGLRRHAPGLGEHTDEVLQELGILR